MKFCRLSGIISIFFLLFGVSLFADTQYAPGVTDTEIKIGNTGPYSGPISGYSAILKTEAAYFEKINNEGGINGRKIVFISRDDGYNPTKTLEQVRRLVEEDKVMCLFSVLGTPTNTAIYSYVASQKVPDLFVASGAVKFQDPAKNKWIMGWQPSYLQEGMIYAKYILKNKSDAKIGVLYQNDDSGKEYLEGFKKGLGDKVGMIVAEQFYNVTDPLIDSQIINLKNSGADVIFCALSIKAAVQTIKKIWDLSWKPLIIFTNTVSSKDTVFKPAGLEKSQGIITTQYLKNVEDRRWKDDKGMKDYLEFMKKYQPSANPTEYFNTYGYGEAMTFTQVLKQCGDNLSRENVLKQAASLNYELPIALPGITIKTSPTDYGPVSQMQIVQFQGDQLVPIGDLIDARIQSRL